LFVIVGVGSQLQNAKTNGTLPTSRSGLATLAVLLYCRDGVLAPPSLLRCALTVKQERAFDRAFALQVGDWGYAEQWSRAGPHALVKVSYSWHA
jgi:hypothetical protein